MPATIIKIEDLCKSFNGNLVLSNINLEIRKGEKLCIVGGSGCGKTVLAKHFIRLLSPDSGRVLVYGKDVSEMSDEELEEIRKKVGYVYQFNALFSSMDVYENISLPLRRNPNSGPAKNEPDIEARVREALKSVGLEEEHLRSMPYELSGGQKKRVAVARAIIANPPIMIYDEPTPGLDRENKENIISLILNLYEKNKNTTIVITHDEDLTERVNDRIVLLRKKKVYFDDPYYKLITSQDPEILQFLSEDEIERRYRTERELRYRNHSTQDSLPVPAQP